MSNNNDSVYTDLARGLAQCAKNSVNMPSPGADKYAQEQQRDAAARSLADPIYEAIKRGLHGVLFFSVDELNKIDKPLDDILYVCNDAGFLFRGLGNAQLSVTRNTFLRWNGYWELVQFSVTTIINNETGGNVSQEIENHNNAVDSHPDIRQDILDEKESRESADSSLQQQIDTITSKSDVVDVVASYAELVAYDTSALGDNDVVKVLADEMHDDAESYYRWDITTETWGYIGSQGPFVTPAEMLTALDGKVDKVAGKGLSTNDFTDAAKSITDNIFLATYNSTSYDDIKAAYDAGKTILCHFTDSRHTVRVATFDRLTHSTTSTSYAYFASVTKTDAYELVASKTRYGTTTTWSGTAKSWGALAEKSNVTNADISGTISDSHIASASTWNGKADKVSNATSGHLAGLDGNGNLTDSGVSPSDIANDIFIAEYGVTTFGEIQTAITNGKTILCSCDWTNDYGIPKKIGHIVLPLATAQELSNEICFCLIVKEVSTYANSQLIEVTCKRNPNTQATTWSLSATEVPNIPKNHASTTSDYGPGSETNYGHVQLTGNVTQNSSKAITSGAVYTALEGISDDIEGKQDALGSNSLAFINKSTSGDATKFLNEQGNFVQVGGSDIEIIDIVVGQTLLLANNVLYRQNNILYTLESRYTQSLTRETYVIFKPLSQGAIVQEERSGQVISYIVNPRLVAVINTSFNVLRTQAMSNSRYNEFSSSDGCAVDGSVSVVYKPNVTIPDFNVLRTAIDNRLDVILFAYVDGYTYRHCKLDEWGNYGTDGWVFRFASCAFGHSKKLYVYRVQYDSQGRNGSVTIDELNVLEEVNTSNIVNGAVTTDKLANSSVTNDKIANGAVGTTKLADNAVTAEKIANGSVGAINSYNHYVNWTLSGSSGGQLYVTKLPSGDVVDVGVAGALNQALVISGSPYPQETMIVLSVGGSGTATMYCNVGSLPSYTLFKLKIVNTSTQYSVKIVFRTNSSTTLAEWRKNTSRGTNSNMEYTISAKEMNDIWFYRGGGSGSATTCYLIGNYNT